MTFDREDGNAGRVLKTTARKTRTKADVERELLQQKEVNLKLQNDLIELRTKVNVAIQVLGDS